LEPPVTKFVPLTVTARVEPLATVPAPADDGLNDVIVGAPMGTAMALVAAPPGFRTVRLSVPTAFMLAAGTVAVIDVEVTAVAVNGLPLPFR
jgi:hypothetical protein